MNATTTKTLETLRDLENVIGSFLVGPTGAVIAQDLPTFFGSAAYDVSPRIQRLGEALTMTHGELSVCVIRFGQHKLALRPVKDGVLSVILGLEVNLPALRMATSLVAKRLAAQFELTPIIPSTPPPPTVRPSAAPPAAADQAASDALEARIPRERAIYFRGRRVK